MKIVIGCDVFYPLLDAGGEVHTYNVAKELVKRGHEVTVVSGKSSQFPDDPQERIASLKDTESVAGINIIRPHRPYPYGSTFGSLPALYDMHTILDGMIRKGKADVANFLMYRPAMPFYLTARHRIPAILTVHIISDSYGTWKGWRDYDGGLLGGLAQKLIEDRVLRFHYNRIIAVSDVQRQRLLMSYQPEKIDLVYNGVELEMYDTVSACGKDPDQIIFVGTLKKRKNVLDAIEAVRIAREKSGRNLKLCIVSSGGEQESEVLSLRDRYDFITYYRRASDELKIKLLKESSLFVFPTSREGFPLVVIEALACCTPFLTYDIPEMKEVVTLTHGGLTVPYGNIEVLAQTIFELLQEETRLKELGKSGRKSVEQSFTWKAVAIREERAFRSAIDDFNKKQ
ncbi:MAG: glycosyltransferase family 4 protein [Methanocella sp.]